MHLHHGWSYHGYSVCSYCAPHILSTKYKIRERLLRVPVSSHYTSELSSHESSSSLLRNISNMNSSFFIFLELWNYSRDSVSINAFQINTRSRQVLNPSLPKAPHHAFTTHTWSCSDSIIHLTIFFLARKARNGSDFALGRRDVYMTWHMVVVTNSQFHSTCIF